MPCLNKVVNDVFNCTTWMNFKIYSHLSFCLIWFRRTWVILTPIHQFWLTILTCKLALFTWQNFMYRNMCGSNFIKRVYFSYRMQCLLFSEILINIATSFQLKPMIEMFHNVQFPIMKQWSMNEIKTKNYPTNLLSPTSSVNMPSRSNRSISTGYSMMLMFISK